MKKYGLLAFNFLASYGFVCVLLFFLLLLTLFGTLEQVRLGIFEAQNKYFNSFILVHHVGPVPILLPGGYLLMSLLFVNLVCGALIRARKDWRRPGMLIAHSGILVLVLSGYVTYHYSLSGHMTLYENERSDEFVSYYDWEILIAEVNSQESSRRLIIGHDQFADMGPEERRTFFAPGLPFELSIHGFERNCTPMRAPMAPSSVDGVSLVGEAWNAEAERNVAGAYAVARETATGTEHQGILWGFARSPWVIQVDGREWAIDLRHVRYPVPFTIVLDDFIKEDHPGISMASNFESRVTKIQGNTSRKVEIKMNEPLRHEGFTFFQASWGPQNARPGEPLFSTFAVVNNPADQWPKYSCYIIGIGLSIHFLQKLAAYLRREHRRRTA